MSILKHLINPAWTSTHILIDTYAHSSKGMSEEFREKFAEFFNDLDEKCCIRLAHIEGKELPIINLRILPTDDNFQILTTKNIHKYTPGTYLLISSPINGDANDRSVDDAVNKNSSSAGLVRALWGPVAAWSLVQRSIVNTSNGNMRDPTPTILIPNAYNLIWDDAIDKEQLTQVLQNHEHSKRIQRSLHLIGRGSDPNESDMALWFWSAMEILCGTEKEVEIKRSLAKAYGSPNEWKVVGEKFGIRHIAQARHDTAHKGNFRKYGSLIMEYYLSLYMDLLSGLYFNKCVRRAERMIISGFNVNILDQQESTLKVLNIEINDETYASSHTSIE